MPKIEDILNQRLAFKDKKPKMAALAQQSAEGNLTSFAGIFGKTPLNEKEKEELASLLNKYSDERTHDAFSSDLQALIHVTSEVKAINNQAAILHGERIKKAQEILKNYKEGAFTAWLMSTYGNRQTPYNFLQYYEFYASMPKTLHSHIESMPRQAVYTLASRQGPLEKKEEIVRNYHGETKQQLITLIRTVFPLPEDDGRRERIVDTSINALQKLHASLQQTIILKMTKEQKHRLIKLVTEIRRLVNDSELTE